MNYGINNRYTISRRAAPEPSQVCDLLQTFAPSATSLGEVGNQSGLFLPVGLNTDMDFSRFLVDGSIKRITFLR